MSRILLGDGVVDLDRFSVLRAGQPDGALTAQEALLLRYLHGTPGRVVPMEELFREVWGFAAGVRSRAVHVAVRRLRRKLEVDPSAPVHLRTIPGAGWVLEPAPSPAGTRIVGRTEELLVLAADMENPDVRLLTLVGPAGVGKTCLAVELGARIEGRCVFCDLTAARAPEDVVATVATGVDLPHLRSAESLGDALAGIGEITLILDNFEQVVDPGSRLVVQWMAAAPHARFLVTSRARLQVPGENARQVEPLTPDAAAALFASRASTALSAADALEVVTRLGCLPLAIELAASQPLHSADALLSRLAGGSALDAAIDSSWRLLDGDEKRSLAALCRFPTSFSVETAEAVLGGEHALDFLQALIDRSFLRRRRGRIDAYVSVREFVGRQTVEADGSAERLCRWYARYGSPQSLRQAAGGTGYWRELVSEAENVVYAAGVALHKGHSAEAALLCIVLGQLARRIAVPGIRQHFERALALDLEETIHTRLVQAWGTTLSRLGEYELAREALNTSLEAARELDDGATEARCLTSIANIELRLGHLDDAERAYLAAAGVSHKVDDPNFEATCLTNLGLVYGGQGRRREQAAADRRALALYRRAGNVWGEGQILGAIGSAAMSESDLTRAIQLLRASGDARRAALYENNLALLHYELGDLDRSERLASRALEQLRIHGPMGTCKPLVVLGAVHIKRGDLEAGSAFCQESRSVARRAGYFKIEADALGCLSDIAHLQGDEATALRLVEEAIEILDQRGEKRVREEMVERLTTLRR